MNRTKLIIASITAPLVVPIGFVLVDIANGQLLSLTWLLTIVGFITFFSYLGMIVFGLPIFFILRRSNLLNLFTLSIAGAIAGILVFFFAGKALGQLLGSSAPFDLKSIAWGALLGLIVALSFSVIAGIKVGSINVKDA